MRISFRGFKLQTFHDPLAFDWVMIDARNNTSLTFNLHINSVTSDLLLFPTFHVIFSFMDFEHFDRITQDPGIMGGKPCIRGMRVTVGMIVGQIGEGVSIDELLSDYPYLDREDVMQALRYAAAFSQWCEVALAEA